MRALVSPALISGIDPKRLFRECLTVSRKEVAPLPQSEIDDYFARAVE